MILHVLHCILFGHAVAEWRSSTRRPLAPVGKIVLQRPLGDHFREAFKAISRRCSRATFRFYQSRKSRCRCGRSFRVAVLDLAVMVVESHAARQQQVGSSAIDQVAFRVLSNSPLSQLECGEPCIPSQRATVRASRGMPSPRRSGSPGCQWRLPVAQRLLASALMMPPPT